MGHTPINFVSANSHLRILVYYAGLYRFLRVSNESICALPDPAILLRVSSTLACASSRTRKKPQVSNRCRNGSTTQGSILPPQLAKNVRLASLLKLTARQ